MFGDGALTFREFVMREPLPLASIHEAVLEFVRGRDDVVLFGAQAVNAYVDEPRMTQDVDLMSTHAADLAEAVRQHLNEQFKIAVRVRRVAKGQGFRVYQSRTEEAGGNRHLVDVRSVDALPAHATIEGVQVTTAAGLIAMKVIAMVQRRGQPKSGVDWRDATLLLLRFPHLRTHEGPVADHLVAAVESGDADPAVIDQWRDLVDRPITPDDDDY